jgi:uncharacterized repeat protein (TIGR03803 family)
MRKPNEHQGLIFFSTITQVLIVVVLLSMTFGAAEAQTFTVLHRFNGFPNDGRGPAASLTQDKAGNLYGTTSSGGTFGGGTVFKLDPTGKKTILFNFFRAQKVDSGLFPSSDLLLDAAGNLYGTTFFGGDHSACQMGCGTLFKLDATGKLTTLHRFEGPEGASPSGGLISDSAGNLYGTAAVGGDLSCHDPGSLNGCGVVFKMDVTGKLTILHAFTNSPDGAWPFADLVRDAAGNLYGVTNFGGDADCQCGTVMRCACGRPRYQWRGTGLLVGEISPLHSSCLADRVTIVE